MTPSPVVLFIVNIMIPLTLHFIIFTGFRVEAVVRKPTAGLSVLKQALVPILMGPLPQQVTINKTLTPRDYLRIVFTAWQFEVEIEIEVKLKWPFSAQTSTQASILTRPLPQQDKYKISVF